MLTLNACLVSSQVSQFLLSLYTVPTAESWSPYCLARTVSWLAVLLRAPMKLCTASHPPQQLLSPSYDYLKAMQICMQGRWQRGIFLVGVDGACHRWLCKMNCILSGLWLQKDCVHSPTRSSEDHQDMSISLLPIEMNQLVCS